jgi:pimeloyl-ACP methyl ester carboxylesterase
MTAHATNIVGLVRGEAAGIHFLHRPGKAGSMPFVFLHGIGSNAGSFESVLTMLPDTLDATAWDAPGYGHSAALSAASPTPRDYAAVLEKFLEARQLSRIVLVGHSLGSLFAASYAAHFPSRVAALALLSPAVGYRVQAGGALPPAVQARIDEIGMLGPAAFAAKRAARLVGDPQGNPKVTAAVEKAMACVHLAGYVQAVRALGAGDLLSDARQLRVPTLVAVGSKDVITPPDNALAVHQALSNDAGFTEIAGAGHALPQEKPEAVARLLTQLVKEHADV